MPIITDWLMVVITFVYVVATIFICWAMVECLRPEPGKTIADPCCGSGGFFLAAQTFLADPKNYSLDRSQKEFLKNETFHGNEIVPATFKTALMNLYLHNIGDIYGEIPITLGDALLSDPGYRVDYVLTNEAVICGLTPEKARNFNEFAA